jgi:N-acetylated-alpha-linked acidic dipeptidase
MIAKRVILLLILTIGIIILNKNSPGQERLKGFYPINIDKELALEKKLKLIPSSTEMGKNLRILTEKAHMAGTQEDFEVAQYVREKMMRYGIQAEIDEYIVYLSYPLEISLEMVEPRRKKFDLREKGWLWDKDSYDRDAIIPFNAFSSSGNITSHLVYVNYGSSDDYKILEDTGINVKGKIVVVRNGKFYRGLKVWLAEKHGASGVIIYSDPADSGYMIGDVYPRGTMLPPSGVERGTILYGFVYWGDPLTPGWPSKDHTKRLKPEEAENLPKIPSIPISYENAKNLLKYLSGPEVPQAWQGGLPFRYHIGPGPAKVNLNVKMESKNRKIWNVIGKIEGTSKKDEWIIMGNHRDSWTFGACDPNSGTAVLLETAESFGKLLKEGYKPSRTIILASWDAEEFGCIGSAEWVEENEDLLRKDCAIYLDVDVGIDGGHFWAGGAPSLRDFTREATKSVNDPVTGLTVYDDWRKNQKLDEPNESKNGQQQIDTQIAIPGIGADYGNFFHFIGASALDWELSGKKNGLLHTQYDNFYVMSTFIDPGFIYHTIMAKLVGISMLRLASCDILPYNYYTYAEEIEKYIDDLGKEYERKIDLANIKHKVTEWKNLCKELNEKIGNEIEKSSLSDLNIRHLNEKLMSIEKSFINISGLPNRSRYKHLIYGPGLISSGYTGLTVTIPGIREAISEGDLDEAGSQLQALSIGFDTVNTITREAINIF